MINVKYLINSQIPVQLNQNQLNNNNNYYFYNLHSNTNLNKIRRNQRKINKFLEFYLNNDKGFLIKIKSL